jgi:ubiquinone/menaquinone biosynthesis C-methylase UbiE
MVFWPAAVNYPIPSKHSATAPRFPLLVPSGANRCNRCRMHPSEIELFRIRMIQQYDCLFSFGSHLNYKMESDKYQETFQTWNKVASLYASKFMHLNCYDASYDQLIDMLPTGSSKVLEVGCGPGNITRYLLSKRPELQIMGIDVAANMIELAKLNCPTANFETMDCRNIPSIEERFDAIVSGFCIPYLTASDCNDFIINCSKLLNPKGLIYLSFVAGNPDQSRYQIGSSGDRMFFNYHELDFVVSILEDLNFTDLVKLEVPFSMQNEPIEMHTILLANRKSLTLQ